MSVSSPATNVELQNALQALRPELVGYLRSKTRSLVEADDVAQLALLKALENLSALSAPEKLRAWVFTIARRTLIDMARRQGREVLTEDDDFPPAPDATSEHACACALALTNSLSPGQAELIRLIDVDEVPLAMAAAQLSSTKNAATVRLHRARENLKTKLRDHCGVTDTRSASRCSCDTRSCTSALKQAQ